MSPSKAYEHPSERDDCKVLMDACGPQLYVQNAFRVTGLHIDATVRECKRHLDELKNAIDFGEKDVAGHGFAIRPLTVDHVRNAAIRLNDPERRLVDEVFWFWPSAWGQSKQDKALASLAKGDKRLALGIWKAMAGTNDDAGRVVANHNLAVIHHMIALGWELDCIRNRKSVSSEQLQKADDCWTKAFGYWEMIWDDDLFWSMVASRVRVIDDARLTTGFARRVRRRLPEGIWQINGTLATQYCHSGNMERSNTHIANLRTRSGKRLDVDSILAAITAPFHKRIDMSVRLACDGLGESPKEGAKRAASLLEATSEPLQTLSIILGKDASELGETRDAVAQAYRSCLVAYGNASEDWTACIRLSHEGSTIPASQKLRKQFEEDLATLEERKKAKDLTDLCWFCKRNSAVPDAAVEVKMHGDVRRTRVFNGTHVEWRNVTVRVPRCSECGHSHRLRWFYAWAARLAGSALAGVGMAVWIQKTMQEPVSVRATLFLTAAIGSVALGLIAKLTRAAIHGVVGCCSLVREFPPVRDLGREGWAIGERPYGVS